MQYENTRGKRQCPNRNLNADLRSDVFFLACLTNKYDVIVYIVFILTIIMAFYALQTKHFKACFNLLYFFKQRLVLFFAFFQAFTYNVKRFYK